MCLGIPGRILSISQEQALPIARVCFDGIIKPVCIAYVPEARVDDYVIVHAGFAISVVDAEAAAGTLDYLEAIGVGGAGEHG